MRVLKELVLGRTQQVQLLVLCACLHHVSVSAVMLWLLGVYTWNAMYPLDCSFENGQFRVPMATNYRASTGYFLLRFEVFTAVTMNNVIFWDIKPQFVRHRKHITSPLQSPASYCYVRSEVFTAVTMKNVIFWDIKPQFVRHRRHITSPLQSPAS
jgi:hypothetical protein